MKNNRVTKIKEALDIYENLYDKAKATIKRLGIHCWEIKDIRRVSLTSKFRYGFEDIIRYAKEPLMYVYFDKDSYGSMSEIIIPIEWLFKKDLLPNDLVIWKAEIQETKKRYLAAQKAKRDAQNKARKEEKERETYRILKNKFEGEQ